MPRLRSANADQQRHAAGADRQRDLVRILEIAAVAHALLDAVRAEQADVLAAVLEARAPASGPRHSSVVVAQAAVGLAVDLAVLVLAADALLAARGPGAKHTPTMNMHVDDEHAAATIWNVRKRWMPCAIVPYSANRIASSSARAIELSGALIAGRR